MHERAILTNMEDVGKYPKDVYAWFNIGMSYFFNDLFAELHYEKAFAYYKLGDMQAAKKELEATLKYDPDYQKAKDLLSLF